MSPPDFLPQQLLVHARVLFATAALIWLAILSATEQREEQSDALHHALEDLYNLAIRPDARVGLTRWWGTNRAGGASRP